MLPSRVYAELQTSDWKLHHSVVTGRPL